MACHLARQASQATYASLLSQPSQLGRPRLAKASPKTEVPVRRPARPARPGQPGLRPASRASQARPETPSQGSFMEKVVKVVIFF